MKYLIIAALILTACSPVKVHFAGYTKKYEPFTGEVRVLDKLPEKKKYITIGELIAEAYLTNPDDQVINKLKKEAAKRGANAIVIRENVSTNIDMNWRSLSPLYKAPKSAKVTAIRIDK
jgi:hypothetical protein